MVSRCQTLLRPVDDVPAHRRPSHVGAVKQHQARRRPTGYEIATLQALVDHAGLVVLPGQDDLTPERQGQIMECFGAPFFRNQGIDSIAMLKQTTVQILGSQAKDGLSDIPEADVDNGRDLVPHSDVQDYQVTPTYTMIHGVEVVPSEMGGSTYFTNLYQAYDELSDEDKALIDGKVWMPASSQATAYGVGMKERRTTSRPTGTNSSPTSAILWSAPIPSRAGRRCGSRPASPFGSTTSARRRRASVWRSG